MEALLGEVVVKFLRSFDQMADIDWSFVKLVISS